MKRLERAPCIQFLKFGIVGIFNTMLSLLVYYVILWIDPEWYLLGNAMGWVAGVANSYFWNDRYVFKCRNGSWKSGVVKFLKTGLCYGGTLLLSTGLLFLEADILGYSKTLCPVFNLLITVPLNFLMNKFWVFR